jgi:hypothetical protein
MVTITYRCLSWTYGYCILFTSILRWEIVFVSHDDDDYYVSLILWYTQWLEQQSLFVWKCKFFRIKEKVYYHYYCSCEWEQLVWLYIYIYLYIPPSAMKQLRSIEREEMDKMIYVSTLLFMFKVKSRTDTSIDYKREKVQLNICNTCDKSKKKSILVINQEIIIWSRNTIDSLHKKYCSSFFQVHYFYLMNCSYEKDENYNFEEKNDYMMLFDDD